MKKSIYGLKQAPKTWFSELSSWLTSYSFSTSNADLSLFIMHIATVHMFTLVYIDDMIITLSSYTMVDTLIHSLG